MAERVRWGILGTGKIARILAQAIAEFERRRAARGRQPRPEARRRIRGGARRARVTARTKRSSPTTRSSSSTWRPTIRSTAHGPIAAADAGKHVLCEKPLAVRHADAAEIVEAARRNDVFLLEAFAYRCHPQTQRLLALVQEGAIGEVRMIDAVFGYDAGPDAHELPDGPDPRRREHPRRRLLHDVDGAPDRGDRARRRGPSRRRGRRGGGVRRRPASTTRPPRPSRSTEGVLARVACSIQANLDSSRADRRIGGPDRGARRPGCPGGSAATPASCVERWGAEPEDVVIERGSGRLHDRGGRGQRTVRAGERSSAGCRGRTRSQNMRTLDRWRAAIGLHVPGRRERLSRGGAHGDGCGRSEAGGRVGLDGGARPVRHGVRGRRDAPARARGREGARLRAEPDRTEPADAADPDDRPARSATSRTRSTP